MTLQVDAAEHRSGLDGGHPENKSAIGANISGVFRVYESMQDEATALVKGTAGADRGTETTEVTMFVGWTSHVINRFGTDCLAGRPANAPSVYPMRQ